jgi:hypothetical protein
MKSMISCLNKLSISHHLSPEILIKWIKKPVPIIASVILSPPRTKMVPRRILLRLG